MSFTYIMEFTVTPLAGFVTSQTRETKSACATSHPTAPAVPISAPATYQAAARRFGVRRWRAGIPAIGNWGCGCRGGECGGAQCYS